MVRVLHLLLILPAAVAFVAPRMTSGRVLTRHHGFMDNLFKGPTPEEKAEKEREKNAQWEAQQKILAKRRSTAGFIPEEDIIESQKRRQKIKAGEVDDPLSGLTDEKAEAQEYVDEGADVMGGFANIFGKKR